MMIETLDMMKEKKEHADLMVPMAQTLPLGATEGGSHLFAHWILLTLVIQFLIAAVSPPLTTFDRSSNVWSPKKNNDATQIKAIAAPSSIPSLYRRPLIITSPTITIEKTVKIMSRRSYCTGDRLLSNITELMRKRVKAKTPSAITARFLTINPPMVITAAKSPTHSKKLDGIKFSSAIDTLSQLIVFPQSENVLTQNTNVEASYG